MVTLQPKRAPEDLSRRMKIAVILILLFILLPSTIVALPVSTIVVTLVTSDVNRVTNICVYLEDGRFLGTGDHFVVGHHLTSEGYSVVFHVIPGTHSVRIVYDYEYAENHFNPKEIWGSYTLLPFETEEQSFDL